MNIKNVLHHNHKVQRFIWAIMLLTGLSLLSACKNLFHYHPGEVRLEESEKNLNAKNLRRIQSLPAQDTFHFALIGDTQRFYDEVDDFVQDVNKRQDVSFVLLAGDITDFGLNKEYKWVHRALKKLAVPYIAVIGNHDLLANGRKVYQEMYGPEDFSFAFSGSKFICLNTNSEEFGFDGTVPNLPWLNQQLSDTVLHKSIFVIAHVPPFSAAFDKKLEQSYASLLAASNRVFLTVYGHQHGYSKTTPYSDGVTYLVTAAMNRRSYILVSVWDDQHKTEQIFF